MKGARDKIELERDKMRNIIESFENQGKGLTIKQQPTLLQTLSLYRNLPTKTEGFFRHPKNHRQFHP